MPKQWTVTLDNANVQKFISDHGLVIRDIRTQSFLGNDIRWELQQDGWIIQLYPRLYYEGPSDLFILHALANILKRGKHWYTDTPGPEFDELTRSFLSENQVTSEIASENYARAIVAFDAALCSSLELHYVVHHGYMDLSELRRLVNYRSENFVSNEVALESLASMAVLKLEGGDTSLFYDTIVKNKWYEMLPIVDDIERCLQNKAVHHKDVIKVFSAFFPHFKEHGLAERIAVLRRNVLGGRDDNELDWDFAISYAREEEALAKALARCFEARSYKVFYDKYHEAELWGKDLFQHLADIYGRRAKYTLLIISRAYAKSQWTTVEREAAQAKAAQQHADYILPIVVDDTQLAGLTDRIAYVKVQNYSIEQLCELAINKLRIVK